MALLNTTFSEQITQNLIFVIYYLSHIKCLNYKVKDITVNIISPFTRELTKKIRIEKKINQSKFTVNRNNADYVLNVFLYYSKFIR